MTINKITFSLVAGVAALIALSSHSNTPPDAYLHAFASGPKNQQLIVRLPMLQQPSGQLVGQTVNHEYTSDLSGTPYAWEVVGKYNEECPTEEQGKLQHLLVLNDDSIVFTCDRTKIFIRHPNRGSMAEYNSSDTAFTTPRTSIVSYHYPEIELDVTQQLTDFFGLYTAFNSSNEYGIALSYNAENQIVYAGIENKVYIIDLKVLAEHKADINSTRRDRYFYPLKHDGKGVVVTSADPDAEQAQIISMAHIQDKATASSYLFTSSATHDREDKPVPVRMLSLAGDGRSVIYREEPQFALAWQRARLEWDHNGSPKGKGLKSDITYLTSDTAPGAAPILTAHLHHNHIGVVNNPHMTSPAITQAIDALEQSETGLTAINFEPDIFNKIIKTSPYHKLSTSVTTDMTRVDNYVVPTTDLKPNYFSYKDRIASRIVKNKPPKVWLNNDVLTVYKGHVYSIPWKDDVTQSVMVHPLGQGGWKSNTLPQKDWAVSAELPDIYYKQRSHEPLYTEVHGTGGATQYHLGTQSFNLQQENLADWFVGAPYWAAAYISSARGD